jgi:uncharacterized phage protein (TIGR01671 family)
MREIKFRAWDKDTNKLFVCDDIYFVKPRFRVKEKEELNNIFSVNDNFVFMQYTGLKDVNGKEIYEGDIVIEGYKGKYGTYEVKWNVKGFNLGSEDGDEYEVIGNIYENPELLERSK